MAQPTSRMVHLLLISDSPEQRDTLRLALAASPYLKVRSPLGTDEAVLYLSAVSAMNAEQRPDLIVLDLPLVSQPHFEVGCALLRKLKTAIELRGVPVVLLGDEETFRHLASFEEAHRCSLARKPVREADVRRMAYHFGEYWGRVARVPPRLENPPNDRPKRAPAPPMTFEGGKEERTIRPVQILVVDDNPDDAILFQESLSALDQIQLARILNDPEAAWEYLHQEGRFHDAPTPDLVVLDLHMPQKTGFALLESIKADAVLRMLPVVILTASRYEEDIWESYSRGASSFVEKPPRFESLCELAKRLANYWTSVAYLPTRFRD